MTTRRDFLRAGLITAAAIVLPDEQFVRRFFPVGIDLARRSPTLYAGTSRSAETLARLGKKIVLRTMQMQTPDWSFLDLPVVVDPRTPPGHIVVTSRWPA